MLWWCVVCRELATSFVDRLLVASIESSTVEDRSRKLIHRSLSISTRTHARTHARARAIGVENEVDCLSLFESASTWSAVNGQCLSGVRACHSVRKPRDTTTGEIGQTISLARGQHACVLVTTTALTHHWPCATSVKNYHLTKDIHWFYSVCDGARKRMPTKVLVVIVPCWRHRHPFHFLLTNMQRSLQLDWQSKPCRTKPLHQNSLYFHRQDRTPRLNTLPVTLTLTGRGILTKPWLSPACGKRGGFDL